MYMERNARGELMSELDPQRVRANESWNLAKISKMQFYICGIIYMCVCVQKSVC